MTDRILLGFSVKSPSPGHDGFERLRAGAEGLDGLELPVFKSECLFVASSIGVCDDDGLDAGKKFEEKAGGDVGGGLVAVVGQPGVGGDEVCADGALDEGPGHEPDAVDESHGGDAAG